MYLCTAFNPLNAELNPICHLLALFGAHHILHVCRIRVNLPSVSSLELITIMTCLSVSVSGNILRCFVWQLKESEEIHTMEDARYI
jgi:hypothetical protein